MKICTKCKQEKPEGDFAFKNKEAGTRSSWCKECFRISYKSRYSDKERDRLRGNRKRNRERNSALLVEYLKEHPCVDCGESDPIVLQFDHIESGPKSRVTEILGRSWAAVLREIEKCQVRCANCHVRRTARQFGWNRLNLV